MTDYDIAADAERLAAQVLAEDVGTGDLTAGLLDPTATATAVVVTRERMLQAGQPYFDAVFRSLDARVRVKWFNSDGDTHAANARVAELSGPAHALLTGERAALNLLQTLSGTATTTARYVDAVRGTHCRILDTRKTLPGLRLAQKYAVVCGGGTNHRIGLFDAVLIKENHIEAAGSIGAAVRAAQAMHPDVVIETEVETLAELEEAIESGAERILLDNFSLEDLGAAVAINLAAAATPSGGRAELEASGNVTLDTLPAIARTGVDFVSIGALTKHVHAVDLSMRFETFE